ncbi:kynureninase [Xanthomonas massiliensis]|uniref:kynureninase n=1 Tax=Xanthomonas massiliensis TaxID=1720302 RepID=UPI0008250A85|nr:kynureninase [Xanthomonas massiliensis]
MSPAEPLSRQHALALDAADPLRALRAQFLFPRHGEGEQHYFVGNSLGLQPRAAAAMVQEVLDHWAGLAVEGHFTGQAQWMTYQELVTEPLARVVGAKPVEVVAMNSLTTNLHLMMASFYRPTAERPAILIEAGAFPSDRHAVESQIRWHGLDPADCLVEVEPDEADGTISMGAIERAIGVHGPRLALVLWPGVQYRTGEAFDLAQVARLARAAGARVGFDLAHAAGNLALALHDSGADFAAWCHYKYLNAGPGAVAGCFVHERHARDPALPRLAGWWGHDKHTRFHMGPGFDPAPGAEGWQLSNPPILALAPLRASLALFEQAGMAALRGKSLALDAHLRALIQARLADVLHVVTPADPARHGCQLSLRVAGGRERGRALFEYLHAHGVLGDWREPDVIRIAPVPMYNRFEDLHAFVETVEAWAGRGGA